MIKVILKEPYWGAWKRYGWEKGVEGYGVDIDIVREAIKNLDKIEIRYDEIAYQVSGKKIKKFYVEATIKPIFTARAGVKLIVIPRTLLTKL